MKAGQVFLIIVKYLLLGMRFWNYYIYLINSPSTLTPIFKKEDGEYWKGNNCFRWAGE